MNNKESCQVMFSKLLAMDMCIFTCREYLPDTYLMDMQEMFNSDPAADTFSKVNWAVDFESGGDDGVITFISESDKDEVCKKLVSYAKEKNIEELHLLYKDENGDYLEMAYDNSGDEFYQGGEVMVSIDGAVWDGFLTILIGECTVGF